MRKECFFYIIENQYKKIEKLSILLFESEKNYINIKKELDDKINEIEYLHDTLHHRDAEISELSIRLGESNYSFLEEKYYNLQEEYNKLSKSNISLDIEYRL